MHDEHDHDHRLEADADRGPADLAASPDPNVGDQGKGALPAGDAARRARSGSGADPLRGGAVEDRLRPSVSAEGAPAASSAPRWWQSLDQLAAAGTPAGDRASAASAGREFAEELPIQIGLPGGPQVARDAGSRRDFFKVMGLSATAAMAACRRAPEQNIYPYTRKPDELVPGVAAWYATACGACPARCGLLVKTRDGRPIKVEGNPSHPVSRGAVCAIGQAAILGLYDDDRARGPRLAGRGASWAEVDAAVGR